MKLYDFMALKSNKKAMSKAALYTIYNLIVTNFLTILALKLLYIFISLIGF